MVEINLESYNEKFSPQEKKYIPKKVGKIEDIENSLIELEKIADNIGDDAIRLDIMSLIEDICTDREICDLCYTKIDEVWLDEGLFRNCNCKSKCIVRNEAV